VHAKRLTDPAWSTLLLVVALLPLLLMSLLSILLDL
jgi:hypothetical protein